MTSWERVVYLEKVFKTEHTRMKWLRAVELLGNVPDKKVARKLGVSGARVCQVRVSMGIPPVTFPKTCARYNVQMPNRPVIIAA